MIYTDYLQRYIDQLTEALERLPKLADQVWELQAIAMYGHCIEREAQKLYSEILREEMRAEKGAKYDKSKVDKPDARRAVHHDSSRCNSRETKR